MLQYLQVLAITHHQTQNLTRQLKITVAACESQLRFQVHVTFEANMVAPPTAPATQTFCSGALVEDLDANGFSVMWYDVPTGGSPLAPATVLVDGSHYYATQRINACESSTRLEVSVSLLTVPSPGGNYVQTFCEGATISAMAVVGSNVQWYSAPTAGFALPSNTLLSDGSVYFASQTPGDCESERLQVMVTLETVAPPLGNTVQTFCEGATISDLAVTGSDVQWYSSLTSEDPLPSNMLLGDNHVYFASQVDGNCESAERLAVTAHLNAIPAPPAGIPGLPSGLDRLSKSRKGNINYFRGSDYRQCNNQ